MSHAPSCPLNTQALTDKLLLHFLGFLDILDSEVFAGWPCLIRPPEQSQSLAHCGQLLWYTVDDYTGTMKVFSLGHGKLSAEG